MKILSASTVILIFLIVLIFGCTKEELTGNAVKATVSDSEGNASSNKGTAVPLSTLGNNSSIGEEGQEGCTIDSRLLDRIFSDYGSL